MKYIIGLVLFTFTIANASSGPIEKLFKGDEYQEAGDYKAIAVAIDHNKGKWVSGWSYNAPSKTSAKKIALKYCWKQAKKHNVGKQCRIYAVGNKRIK